MNANVCPSIDHLRHFVHGTLPAEETTSLARHLATCPSCLKVLGKLQAHETVAEQLRAQSEAGDTAVRDALEPVIKGLEQPAGDKTTGLNPSEMFPFLAPAREPGELGWLAHYRVLKLLGAGGMGMVFQAEDTHLQRLVALKVMRQELVSDVGAKRRFLEEARAAASLKHEHIVTIYQVGQEKDVPFLAMEYLEGESLDTRLDRQGKLPLADILRLGREMAEGLAAAHERGLIHRDIKPANVWLEKHGMGGRVKLLDFGLARRVGATGITSAGVILGTPKYMAPEQARGQSMDHRCDLFSLGCVLYRMAAGQGAFDGSDTMAVLASLAVDDPRHLLDLEPGLPPALCDLVHQLLAKKPENRPASATEVAQTLRSLEKSPTTVRVAPRSTRTIRVTGGGGRRWKVLTGILVLVAGLLGGGLWFAMLPHGPKGPPIKVGVLHSLSGTIADSGNSVVDATLLAIDEINEKGGLLGRPVEAIVRDGQSDGKRFGPEGERLITEDRVCTIFGCWTSASRKELKPVVEKHNHLLLYPVPTEGLEESPNIVYNGAAPNQLILPAVRYCVGFMGKKKFFLVGSDYVYPRTANAIVRDELKGLGAEIVGEEYLPLGDSEVGGIVKQIQASGPDLVLSTIVGDSNRAFFRALRTAKIKPDRLPVVSFAITENELRGLSREDMVGDYAAWNYFQSVDRPENRAFLKRFHAKYGSQRVTSDPMEAAYFGVHLWAQAVRDAGSDDVNAIREKMKGQSYDAPGGTVRIDPENLHTWKTIRLGKIQADGQFEVVWSSEKPIRPEPFPASRTREEWEKFLDELYRGWGGNWARPE